MAHALISKLRPHDEGRALNVSTLPIQQILRVTAQSYGIAPPTPPKVAGAGAQA